METDDRHGRSISNVNSDALPSCHLCVHPLCDRGCEILWALADDPIAVVDQVECVVLLCRAKQVDEFGARPGGRRVAHLLEYLDSEYRRGLAAYQVHDDCLADINFGADAGSFSMRRVERPVGIRGNALPARGIQHLPNLRCGEQPTERTLHCSPSSLWPCWRGATARASVLHRVLLSLSSA